MARKTRAKLIMGLRERELSRRKIAKTRHTSMESVCEVFDIAAERGISWGEVKDMPDDDVYRMFYPDKHARDSVFEEPDWGYVHAEMAKVGGYYEAKRTSFQKNHRTRFRGNLDMLT